MAFELPKIDLADAKTRVLILVAGVLGFVALIYIGKLFFTKGGTTAGPSHVANAPGNLQSVPGGQLTPEYYRALVQANAQAAKQAQISGASAVPTLLNVPGAQPSFQSTTPSCSVVCPSEENANVENDINDLVKSGKLSAEDGKKLSALAQQNVAVSEYAAHLDELVKQGKLTPDQARKLLDDYKKQHQNALIQESGAEMDKLIKSGKLPIDVANELLDMQKNHATPEEYAQRLNELVREGKISPQTAAELLGQYTQQQAREASKEAMGQLEEMAASGQIKPEVAKELADYQKRHVSEKEYAEELQHLVNQGKLTPEQAQRLLEQYRQQIPPDVAAELADAQKRNVPLEEYQAKLQQMVAAGKISPQQAQRLLEQYRKIKTAGTGTMTAIVQKAKKANDDALKKMADAKQISAETAQKLADLQRANVPPDEYKRQLDQLVKEGKISAQQADALYSIYQKWYRVRGEGEHLATLRANNISLDEYAAELKRAVEAGLLTLDEAAQLLQEYEGAQAQQAAVPTAPLPNVKGAEAFAALQKRLQAAAPTVAPPKPPAAAVLPANTEQLNAAQAKAKALAEQQEQQRLQSLMNAMSTQAGQLINAWQPPVMSGQAGAPEPANPLKAGGEAKTGSKESSSSSTGGGGQPSSGPIIKAGSIVYAILDTGVNSDYPDSPVLATVVSGEFKGAKLLGKLAITQGQDRVSLTFKLMNMDSWLTGKTVNAYAIDPDTARTVLASNVNYHYFLRYGGLFASSFVQGYAQAISSSGATTSLSVTGSTTTNPVLSPSSKLMTGLGAVGQAFSKVAQTYTNTPPTVTIDAGVSLGILFMTDVSG